MARLLHHKIQRVINYRFLEDLMKKVLLVVAALSVLMLASTAHANLITNGGFDNGLNGWSDGLLSSLPAWDSNAQAAKFGYGAGFINGANQSLFQAFHINPDIKSVTFSFDLTTSVNSPSILESGVFTAAFNSLNFNLKDFVADFTWLHKDGSITTTFSKEIEISKAFQWFGNDWNNAAVLFKFTGGGLGSVGGMTVLLDNVFLGPTAQTPIPAAAWLLGSGVAGLVALRRKQVA